MRRSATSRFSRPLSSFVIGSLFVLAVLAGVGFASFVLAELGGWGAFDIKLGPLEFFSYEVLNNDGWNLHWRSGTFYLAILAGLLNALRPLFFARHSMATLRRD